MTIFLIVHATSKAPLPNSGQIHPAYSCIVFLMSDRMLLISITSHFSLLNLSNHSTSRKY